MTLRIERYLDGVVVVLHLSGNVRLEHISQLKAELAKEGGKIAFDLKELVSVDLEVIQFLGSCEASGVGLRNCSRYIRQWIRIERGKAGIGH